MKVITDDGLDVFIAQLKTQGADASALKDICDQIIYDGAGVVADAIRSEIQALPIRGNKWAKSGEKLTGVTVQEKQGLLRTLGIKQLGDRNGIYDRKIGFDGYVETQNSRIPVPMIVRSHERGCSWLTRNPFVTRAVNSCKQEVLSTMEKKLDKILQERNKS